MTIRETPSPSWRAIEKPPARAPAPTARIGRWRRAAAAKRQRRRWTTGLPVSALVRARRRPTDRRAEAGAATPSRRLDWPAPSRRPRRARPTAPVTETGSIRFQSERRTRPTSGGLTVSRSGRRGGSAASAVTGRRGGDGREADERDRRRRSRARPFAVDDQPIGVVERVDAVARDTGRVEHDARRRIRMPPDPDLPDQVAVVEPERPIERGRTPRAPRADRRKSATVPQCRSS